MVDLTPTTGKGVLNKTTRTVHKHVMGEADLQTRCRRTHHIAHKRLRLVDVERAAEELNAEKCGECFEDGGGY